MSCADKLDSRAGERDIVTVCSYEPNWFQSFHMFFAPFNWRAKAHFLFVLSVEC